MIGSFSLLLFGSSGLPQYGGHRNPGINTNFLAPPTSSAILTADSKIALSKAEGTIEELRRQLVDQRENHQAQLQLINRNNEELKYKSSVLQEERDKMEKIIQDLRGRLTEPDAPLSRASTASLPTSPVRTTDEPSARALALATETIQTLQEKHQELERDSQEEVRKLKDRIGELTEALGKYSVSLGADGSDSFCASFAGNQSNNFFSAFQSRKNSVTDEAENSALVSPQLHADSRGSPVPPLDFNSEKFLNTPGNEGHARSVRELLERKNYYKKWALLYQENLRIMQRNTARDQESLTALQAELNLAQKDLEELRNIPLTARNPEPVQPQQTTTQKEQALQAEVHKLNGLHGNAAATVTRLQHALEGLTKERTKLFTDLNRAGVTVDASTGAVSIDASTVNQQLTATNKQLQAQVTGLQGLVASMKKAALEKSSWNCCG